MPNPNKAIKLLLVLTIFIAALTPISAQTDTDSGTTVQEEGGEREDNPTRVLRDNAEERQLTREQRQAEIAELRAERAEGRCTKVQENFTKRINRYNDNYDRVVEKYQDIAAKIRTALDKLIDAGVDVSAVEDDYAQLATMLREIGSTKTTLISELQAAQQIDCTDTEGLRDALSEVKATLSDLREQIKAKKDFVKNDLLPEIRTLIQELRSANNS